MSTENTPGRWKLLRPQLWAFLNSNFGLFFLSSVVLSLVTWSYTELSHTIEQRSANVQNVKKLNTEIDYRIRLIENYFDSECSEDSNVSEKTFSDIRNIYNAVPKYQSIFPENKQKQLHVLIWEMSAHLADANEKQDFVKSFEQLTGLYAYLNRFVDQTKDTGMIYNTIPDYRLEATKVKKCFSMATQAVASVLGFDTGTNSSHSPAIASSPTLDLDACAELGAANPATVQTGPATSNAIIAEVPRERAEMPAAGPSIENVEELLGIPDTSATIEQARDKPFLMAIEDVFSISGRGVVATGRIDRGTVNVGDEVEIVGIKKVQTTTVTSVEMFRKIVDQGRAGENVGFLLRDMERGDVERGQVLAKPGSIAPHTRFEAKVYMLSKDEGGRDTPFSNDYRPQFYFRTTDVPGAVALPQGIQNVMPGETAEIQVELQVPIAMEKGLRFAIREGGRTVGEGVVSALSNDDIALSSNGRH